MPSKRREPGKSSEIPPQVLTAPDTPQRRLAELERENAGLREVGHLPFQAVLEALPAYVVLLTEDHHVAFANRFFRERFGESRGRCCYAYLFERTQPCENCETYKVLDTHTPHRWTWAGPDGRTYDVHDFPFLGPDGRRLILEMGTDVTEHRRAEEELRRQRSDLEDQIRKRSVETEQTNARLQVVIDSLSEGLITSDPEGRLLYWNPAALAIHGLSSLSGSQRPPADLIGLFELFELADANGRVLPIPEWPLSRILGGEALNELELHVRKRHGDWRRILLFGGRLARDAAGQPLLGVLTVTDVTERRDSEQALAKSEESLRQANEILEALTVGADVLVNAVDLEFRLVFFNRSYQEELVRLTGKVAQVGMNLPDAFAEMPGLADDVRNLWTPAFRGEGSRRQVRFGDPNRYQRVYNLRLTPIRDAQGRVVGAGQVAFDVTEQVRSEEQLMYLASFPERNPNPVMEVDLEGNVGYMNKATLVLLPGLRESGVAHPWLADWAEVVRLFREGRTEPVVRDVAVGDRVYQQSIIPVIRKELIRIYADEVTARKRAEDALAELNRELEQRVDERTAELHKSHERYRVKCEQLEVLSTRLSIAQEEERRRIAQGLHDEVCQLLVACHLKLGALRRATPPDEQVPLAEEIDQLLSRAGDELRGLAFELTSSTLYDVGFEEAVEELSDHMETTFGVRFTVEWDGQRRVVGDQLRASLYHAVHELMNNVVKHAGVDHATVRIGGAVGLIRIELEDDGRGFDPAAPGQASGRSGGFGLMSVQGRLRAIGASLDIQSAPGSGTRVVIEAPAGGYVP